MSCVEVDAMVFGYWLGLRGWLIGRRCGWTNDSCCSRGAFGLGRPSRLVAFMASEKSRTAQGASVLISHTT